MAINPKPYLEYLDKEMTIMGLLSAFSVALASFATEKIISANKGFLCDLWTHGQDHVITGALLAVLSAYFFYLQRSHLAWYYGQITLSEARAAASPVSLEDWLTWADGWDTWTRYQTGFTALTLSFASYAYAVTEALTPSTRAISPLWSLWLPLSIAALIAGVHWYGLTKFSQEEYPFTAWWKSIQKRGGVRS